MAEETRDLKTETEAEKAVKKVRTVNRITRIILIIVAVLVVLFVGLRLYFRIPARAYYGASEGAFVIPGLSDGMVPQGIDFEEDTATFYVTGYQKNETATRVYLVDDTTGNVRNYVSLTDENGNDAVLHAGGITVHGGYVYIAGCPENKIYVYDRDEIFNAGNGSGVKCLGVVETYFDNDDPIVVDFTSEHDGLITVGEFFKEGSKYETPQTHKSTSPAGELCQALAVTYSLDETAENGIDMTPVAAYALPDCAQGMAFYDGKIFVSTSYGLSFSHIFVYDEKTAAANAVGGKTISFGETVLPLVYLDSAAQIADITAPPMSEELVFAYGRMYNMSESASSKYIFGKFTGGSWCYATDIMALITEEK